MRPEIAQGGANCIALLVKLDRLCQLGERGVAGSGRDIQETAQQGEDAGSTFARGQRVEPQKIVNLKTYRTPRLSGFRIQALHFLDWTRLSGWRSIFSRSFHNQVNLSGRPEPERLKILLYPVKATASFADVLRRSWP